MAAPEDARAIPVADRPPDGRGFVDEVSRTMIRGWAIGGDPDVPVRLQVLDNGRLLARVLANSYRGDLEAAGVGNGRHAFELLIPGGLPPTSRHIIQVRRESDGSELAGSPRVIEAAGGFEGDLADAVAAAVTAAGDKAERGRLLFFLQQQAETLLQLQADADGQRDARHLRDKSRRRAGALADAPLRRALIIDAELPAADRDAGSQAILSHATALRALDYEVSFVAAEALAATPATRLPFTVCAAPFYTSVEDVLRRQAGCFDIVYLHRGPIAERYLALARRYQPRARLLYSVADLHHLRLERQAAVEERPELLVESRIWRLRECTAAWSAHAVLTHSTTEAALLRQMVPEAQVHCVLWHVPERPPGPAFAARRGLAFIGHYGHAPNVDAATWLVEAVMPLVWQEEPTVTCILAGSAPPEQISRLADKRVKVPGHVRDLGTSVLDRVRLTVAPLRYGAGVKGKVLESFAAGVPCAMTPLAAEGVAVPADLVAADAPALAALILRLHTDEAANTALAAEGRALVRDACGAEVIAAGLRQAIG